MIGRKGDRRVGLGTTRCKGEGNVRGKTPLDFRKTSRNGKEKPSQKEIEPHLARSETTEPSEPDAVECRKDAKNG